MILVIGQTGQVASELKAFNSVLSLGREHVDLSDPMACGDAILFHKPKAVINAAAYTAVDEAESNENLAQLINGEAPASMAQACAVLKIPLVHISTDYVFDGSGNRPWCPSDMPDPRTAYGRSKLEGEKAIEASGCIYAILRTSWVFSAHGNNFVKTMLRLSKSRSCLKVVDDQIGGPTNAQDIAKTCVSIAKQLCRDPGKTGIYHYTGEPDVSWCQFANVIFEETENLTVASPIMTSEYPAPASRPLNSRLNCSKTKDVFGISRPLWRNGLKYVLQEMDDLHDRS